MYLALYFVPLAFSIYSISAVQTEFVLELEPL